MIPLLPARLDGAGASALRLDSDAGEVSCEMRGKQVIDLRCSGLKDERAPGKDAIVHPVLGPVRRGRDALLGKAREAKALLLLETTRYENVDVRLHDRIVRAGCGDILRPSDIDPGLQIRRD